MSSIRYPSITEFWPATRVRRFVKALGMKPTKYEENIALLAEKAGVHPKQMDMVNPVTFAQRNFLHARVLLGELEYDTLRKADTHPSATWAYAMKKPIPPYLGAKEAALHNAIIASGLLASGEVVATYDKDAAEFVYMISEAPVDTQRCREFTLPVGITLEELVAMTPEELEETNARGLAEAREAERLFVAAEATNSYAGYKEAAALGHKEAERRALKIQGDYEMGRHYQGHAESWFVKARAAGFPC